MPDRPCSVTSCPPTAVARPSDAELEPLAGDRRAHLGAAAQQHLGGLGRLRGEHDGRARVDDPGLLAGDLGDRRAEQRHVVEPDRQHDAGLRVQDVGGVPGPPSPTSTHRGVDGGVGEGAKAMPVSTSKKVIGTSLRASTSSTYGCSSSKAAAKRSSSTARRRGRSAR